MREKAVRARVVEVCVIRVHAYRACTGGTRVGRECGVGQRVGCVRRRVGKVGVRWGSVQKGAKWAAQRGDYGGVVRWGENKGEGALNMDAQRLTGARHCVKRKIVRTRGLLSNAFL